MKPIKSERGQASIPVALIAILILAVVYFGLLANQSNIAKGAETLGEAAVEVIETYTYNQDVENLVWQFEQSTVTYFWLNQQKLRPNKHAIKNHGDDAWATTNCYNNNGAFQVWMANPFEFHVLCKDNDSTIRDLILGRETTTSREFFVKNAFTPKKGILKNIIYWLREGKNAQQVNPPTDIIINVDGVIP